MKKMTPKDLHRWIGSQIYKERTSRKISQEALAEAVNVSRVFISRLENGNQAAKLDTYYRIACTFDISLCELFCGNIDVAALDGIQFLFSDSTDEEIRAYTEILRAMKKQLSPLLK